MVDERVFGPYNNNTRGASRTRTLHTVRSAPSRSPFEFASRVYSLTVTFPVRRAPPAEKNGRFVILMSSPSRTITTTIFVWPGRERVITQETFSDRSAMNYFVPNYMGGSAEGCGRQYNRPVSPFPILASRSRCTAGPRPTPGHRQSRQLDEHIKHSAVRFRRSG